MCAGPDALVSSNEAAAAAQQSAAPAVPSSPGPSAVPAVPDHDGGAGPRRKTALADAGDADARARAPWPRVDPSRVAEPPPRAPDRDRAAPRAPPRVPAAVFPARGEAFATRAPGFANRRSAHAPPAFQTDSRSDAIDADLSIHADASWLEVGASEKPSSSSPEKKRPRPLDDDDEKNGARRSATVCPHALCERFGRDARLDSVDRETPREILRPLGTGTGTGTGTGKSRSRDASDSDESPSLRRRLDRCRDESRFTSDAHSRRDSAVRDFGPLMDLLEGRPAEAARCQTLSNESAELATFPDDSVSLFADDPRDSVLLAVGRFGSDGSSDDGGGVFERRHRPPTLDRARHEARALHEARDEVERTGGTSLGFLDALLVDAVDGVFGDGVAPRFAEMLFPPRDASAAHCAYASAAPRITPPTPRVPESRLDPAAPAFAPRARSLRSSRVNAHTLHAKRDPRTAKGRRIAPAAFAEAHFVPRERRAMWAGPSGTLPSAREVLRLVNAMAETQTRVGVPPFA
jgi:hypothetical protein